MNDLDSHLDCCEEPRLATHSVLYQGHHDSESICECERCGAFWFYRYNEYVTFAYDDDWTLWATRLSEEEAGILSDAQATEDDRRLLRERPAFRLDREGVQVVIGQPTHPRM